VDVRLSVIIPTLGRPSLEATLESCKDADEIVVVLDTARGTTELPCVLPSNAVFLQGNWGITGGHAGRVAGIQRATGTHLAFMDDDDIWAPGAADLMREHACDLPVIFRMDHYAHGILWRAPVVEFGNVSTQMYLVPNEPARFGSWEPHIPGIPEPGGDYTFIAGTVAKMGGPVWREEIVAILRPEIQRWVPPSISIVTCWHAHPELAADYVHAVEDELADDDEVIIIDNGGAPALPIQFRVIEAGANLGFAEGSNLGLHHAEADAVLFLNNDIALGQRGWLDAVRNRLEPGLLVGPLNPGYHASVDGTAMPYIDGWCLAGMREDLLELGGFDTTLEEPAYYSDNLLCLEARAVGMALTRDFRVGLVHKLNATAGHGSEPSVQAAAVPNRDRYLSRARALLVAA
jgi:GT2 family glycosyltransferase